jgi:hypothetical protein
MTLSRLGVGLAVVFILTVPVVAGPVVYTYAGNHFNNHTAPFSFSFSDGVQMLTNGSALTIVDFDIVPDSSGTITQCYVALGLAMGGLLYWRRQESRQASRHASGAVPDSRR